MAETRELSGLRRPVERAVLIQDTSQTDPFVLLDETVTQAGLWAALAQRRRALRKPSGAPFSIVILPDFGLSGPASALGTNPALVECLVDSLFNKGYTQVSLVGTPSGSMWRGNRDDLLAIADLVGYHFVTPQGHGYDVLDLTDDTQPAPVPAGKVLEGAWLGKAWVEADFRITFAKNKTDEADGYAAGLHTLLGLLPDWEAAPSEMREDAAVELMRYAPPHFCIIDAWVSNHGAAGGRTERPLPTHTFIASRSLLLADWVAALKMGVDPCVSPLFAAAYRRLGLPMPHEIVGDLIPYPSWENVPPLLMDSVRRRDALDEVRRITHPLLSATDAQHFPFKEPMDAKLHEWATQTLGASDTRPASFYGMIATNYLLGAAGDALTTWRTLWDKDRLLRLRRPVELEPTRFDLSDYDALQDYLQPLEALIGQTTPDRAGLRRRTICNAILFQGSREIAVSYERWTQRVDITQAIAFMNDYIGGSRVPVSHDDEGRITRQSERNVYLPQPNYVAFFGGGLIDVVKIERIVYANDFQKIYWRTVESPNGSATLDDGTVTFERVGKCGVRVTICALQQFGLPPALAAARLELYPAYKELLVAQAYQTFFDRTMSNFEACYEQREFQIGRNTAAQPPNERTPTAQMAEAALDSVHRARQKARDAGVMLTNRPQPTHTDEDGFVHFSGDAGGTTPASSRLANVAQQVARTTTRSTMNFFTEWAEAVRRDFEPTERP